MIALTFRRSVPRYVAARASGRWTRGALAPALAPLRLGHADEPELPGPDWVRVQPVLSGICGSDLAMIHGHASFYFGPLVSTPFVPGHEVVGRLLADCGDLTEGTRVVLQPVLACAARAIEPPCPSCQRGQIGACERTAVGHVAPGLQTGFCSDTAGGWGQLLVAHRSQLHPVPDELSDEAAVLIEPLACAVHAVIRAGVEPRDTVLVSGAGTMGLLTIAALRQLHPDCRVIAAAKHPVQRREAVRLGADEVCDARTAMRAVRLATRSLMHQPERGQPWLTAGADVSFECAGNTAALDTCLRATRARGRVVLVGLPGEASLDLAPVWHRELELVGAYTYGLEPDGRHTFDVAIDIAKRVDIASLISARYPLSRYREALDHASDAGRLDSVKVVFDLAR